MNYSPAEPEKQRSPTAGGTLYVVATPIGNLADMVPRARETLQQVDLIAAEDTRHSKRLLEHFHISTPMVAYHDHNEAQSLPTLLQRLGQGESVALISDAGTPLISDPGYRLVREARDAGFRICPIPGASALVAALSAAGLPSDRFVFEGFLPAKSGARRKSLDSLAAEERTLIFYETPHRIAAALADVVHCLGAEREVVLARELTKTFETILAGSAAELLQKVEEDPNQQRGEIVLLIRGAQAKGDELDADARRIMSILTRELPLKQAASLTAEISGAKKNALYQWALAAQK